ncbi:uncharacterized protein LOC111121308 [Crassostrea virginica]
MALSFLPSSSQHSTNLIAARDISQELRQLVANMDTNWIGSAVWQSRNWSIFQDEQRCRRINADVDKSNATFFILVPASQREARPVDLTVRLVSEKQLGPTLPAEEV